MQSNGRICTYMYMFLRFTCCNVNQILLNLDAFNGNSVVVFFLDQSQSRCATLFTKGVTFSICLN